MYLTLYITIDLKYTNYIYDITLDMQDSMEDLFTELSKKGLKNTLTYIHMSVMMNCIPSTSIHNTFTIQSIFNSTPASPDTRRSIFSFYFSRKHPAPFPSELYVYE